MAKSKKLSIKKMEGDDFEGAKGNHGIFDGEDFVGHVHADDFKDYLKSCMDGGFGGLDDLVGDGKTERAPGATGGSGKGDLSEEVRAALKFAETHKLVEAREAQRTAFLSECCKDGLLDNTKAAQLAREGKVHLEDYIAAQEAHQALHEALQSGKVLPCERSFLFRDAMERPVEFKAFLAARPAKIGFGSLGLGSTEQIPVDQEVDLETRKIMATEKVGYAKAMKELFRANPQLAERYRAAHRQEVKPDAPAAREGITQ